MANLQELDLIFLDPKLTQFENLICDLISSDQGRVSRAQFLFALALISRPDPLLLALSQLLSGALPDLRAQAAKHLGEIFTKFFSSIFLEETTLDILKSNLLCAFRNEMSKSNLDILFRTISDFHATRSWPELLPYLFECVKSRSYCLPEYALLVFKSLAENSNGNASLIPHLNTFKEIFSECLGNCWSLDVKIAALDASISFVQFIPNREDPNRFDYLLTLMMLTLTEAWKSGSENETEDTLHLLIKLAETEPTFFERQLEEVLLLMMKIRADDSLNIQHLAIEFLTALVEKAPTMISREPRFIKTLFDELMHMLLNIEEVDDAPIANAAAAAEEAAAAAEEAAVAAKEATRVAAKEAKDALVVYRASVFDSVAHAAYANSSAAAEAATAATAAATAATAAATAAAAAADEAAAAADEEAADADCAADAAAAAAAADAAAKEAAVAAAAAAAAAKEAAVAAAAAAAAADGVVARARVTASPRPVSASYAAAYLASASASASRAAADLASVSASASKFYHLVATTVGSNGDEVWKSSNYILGRECLSKLFISLGEKTIFQWDRRLFSHLLGTHLLDTSTWKQRHAVLIAIQKIAKGCDKVMLDDVTKKKKVMLDDLDEIVPVVLKSLNDLHPYVRLAAINAIRQLSVVFHPDLQEQYDAIVLIPLVKGMEDFLRPRLQAAAASTALTFVTNGTENIIDLYMWKIIDEFRIFVMDKFFIEENFLRSELAKIVYMLSSDIDGQRTLDGQRSLESFRLYLERGKIVGRRSGELHEEYLSRIEWLESFLRYPGVSEIDDLERLKKAIKSNISS